MAIKYYYIDDDPTSIIEETAKGLSILPDTLVVESYQHKKWGQEIEFIIENQSQIDGLLLDWGLINPNSDDEKADFNVEALAQQIRRFTVDKKSKLKKDFPIVLCSAQTNFKEVFSKELTGHDLFDIVYEKDDFDDFQEKVISELTDLAIGYNDIHKNKSVLKWLGLQEQDETDIRIIDNLENQLKEKSPTHEIARFILTKVINLQGVLIDEYLLAARLGVDIVTHKDRKSWDKLKEQLPKCSYEGVFSNAWQRWWMSKISDWMRERSLGSKSPKEQVAQLNKEFGLKLKAAEKTEKSRSNEFWVICKNTKRPIALEDAVIAAKDVSSVPWEEDEYYSIDEALTVDVKEIHPMERERLKKLKKLNTLKRPKK